MRELVSTLGYVLGTSAVADVLAVHPDTTIRFLSCHVTPDHLWRVDYATGAHSKRCRRSNIEPARSPSRSL
ncbi:hypothetical protein [Halocalculus aciditolerans]